jgi:hypothetical protein
LTSFSIGPAAKVMLLSPVSICVSDETYVSLFIQYKPKLQELMILELAKAKKSSLG